MLKQSLREGGWFAQGHTTGPQQSWDWKSSLPDTSYSASFTRGRPAPRLSQPVPWSLCTRVDFPFWLMELPHCLKKQTGKNINCTAEHTSRLTENRAEVTRCSLTSWRKLQIQGQRPGSQNAIVLNDTYLAKSQRENWLSLKARQEHRLPPSDDLRILT